MNEKDFQTAAQLIMRANDIQPWGRELIILFCDNRAKHNQDFIIIWLKGMYWRCISEHEAFQLDLLSERLRNKIQDKFLELEH